MRKQQTDSGGNTGLNTQTGDVQSACESVLREYSSGGCWAAVISGTAAVAEVVGVPQRCAAEVPGVPHTGTGSGAFAVGIGGVSFGASRAPFVVLS